MAAPLLADHPTCTGRRAPLEECGSKRATRAGPAAEDGRIDKSIRRLTPTAFPYERSLRAHLAAPVVEHAGDDELGFDPRGPGTRLAALGGRGGFPRARSAAVGAHDEAAVRAWCPIAMCACRRHDRTPPPEIAPTIRSAGSPPRVNSAQARRENSLPVHASRTGRAACSSSRECSQRALPPHAGSTCDLARATSVGPRTTEAAGRAARRPVHARGAPHEREPWEVAR